MPKAKEDYIAELAEQIAWLDADGIWALAQELTENYPVPANILKADLETVEFDTE